MNCDFSCLVQCGNAYKEFKCFSEKHKIFMFLVVCVVPKTHIVLIF